MTLLDSTGVSMFVDILLVELTNTVFVDSTNISANIETAVLSKPDRKDINFFDNFHQIIILINCSHLCQVASHPTKAVRGDPRVKSSRALEK